MAVKKWKQTCTSSLLMLRLMQSVIELLSIPLVRGNDGIALCQVPDEVLIERVSGRRSDPETGEIYHMTYKPPPADIVDRLVQRSDDTAEKMVTRLKTYHSNLDAITDIYKDVTVHVDGNREIDDVFGSIVDALEGVLVA
eukprot:evm.model.scf_1723.2 EVM.evm.TU.scf_1723.2   scf_1723:32316-34160(-)